MVRGKLLLNPRGGISGTEDSMWLRSNLTPAWFTVRDQSPNRELWVPTRPHQGLPAAEDTAWSHSSSSSFCPGWKVKVSKFQVRLFQQPQFLPWAQSWDQCSRVPSPGQALLKRVLATPPTMAGPGWKFTEFSEHFVTLLVYCPLPNCKTFESHSSGVSNRFP